MTLRRDTHGTRTYLTEKLDDLRALQRGQLATLVQWNRRDAHDSMRSGGPWSLDPDVLEVRGDPLAAEASFRRHASRLLGPYEGWLEDERAYQQDLDARSTLRTTTEDRWTHTETFLIR